MTTLMEKALRRLTQVPETEQDRVAQRVLSLPELTAAGSDLTAAGEVPSLVSIISSVPTDYARSKAEIDEDLSNLRDEWER